MGFQVVEKVKFVRIARVRPHPASVSSTPEADCYAVCYTSPQRGRLWQKGEALANNFRQCLPRDGEGGSTRSGETDEAANNAGMLFRRLFVIRKCQAQPDLFPIQTAFSSQTSDSCKSYPRPTRHTAAPAPHHRSRCLPAAPARARLRRCAAHIPRRNA